VSKAAFLRFLFVFFLLFSLFVLTINLLDKLNFEDGAITIIDVCETIGAAPAQLFVNVCIIIVIGWSHI
jgi:hypothetical protein